MANSELPEKMQLTATELRLQQNAEYFKEQDNVKEYVVESPRLDAQGLPVSEGRVLTSDSFAKACDGILELTDKGEVVYKACFAAGTLVHTDKGLVPIEKVRVGTRVLSQPEQGGEQDYRAVINTMAHLDQQVYAVQVKVDGADTLTTLIAKPNHPFWVESPVVDGSHWMATECLQPGFVLQVADGRKASVHAAGLIRSTQYPNIGFAADDRAGVGMVLDLTSSQIGLADDEVSFNVGTLDLGEPYLTPVYNFTVDEFHTYYVADTAVWVHNTYKAGLDGAVDTAMERAQIEGECFVGETLVWIKPWVSKFNGVRHDMSYIEDIEVGDEVLSRCEITGEMAYKKVTKVFAHRDAKVSAIGCNLGPEHYAKFGPQASAGILTTANHPFWVEGKGWTKVRDLQPGDEFLTHNGVKATFRIANLDAFEEDVYNFEVEDFHTYFVEGPGIWVHNKSPIDFKRMDTNAVADPKPQWTPLHDSEANLTASKAELEQRQRELADITNKTADERQEVKNNNQDLKDINDALKEAPAQKTMGTAGIQTTRLPAKYQVEKPDGKMQNNLGRIDPVTKEPKGYPDTLLTSTRFPDLNGVVAEIFTPEGKASLASTFKTMEKKSRNQSSVLVVDLRDAGVDVTMNGLLDVLRGKTTAEFKVEGQPSEFYKGPIETLRTLLLIDKNGELIRVDFPKTTKNDYTYGQVTITDDGISTQHFKSQPSNVLVKAYSPQRDIDATYLQADTQGDQSSAQTVSVADVTALLPIARQYWLDAGASASVLNSVDVTIGNLAPRIAAMTLGNEITLSADGAGWGWFVDATPTAQEEYGAGDAANEFHALAGSAAENKMDLLTVLVHELGHVLGLGHVSGNDDLMAEFLTPGVRRLPSLADMATLVATQGAARQSGSLVIGATYTLNAPASTTPNSAQAPSWQHEFVVSAGFATLHNLTPDWTTTGNVVISGDVATLNEVRSSQTSLRQDFMVGANDHEIAFTLEDRQLSGQTKGPNDAFSGAHVARGLPNLHLIST